MGQKEAGTALEEYVLQMRENITLKGDTSHTSHTKVILGLAYLVSV